MGRFLLVMNNIPSSEGTAVCLSTNGELVMAKKLYTNFWKLREAKRKGRKAFPCYPLWGLCCVHSAVISAVLVCVCVCGCVTVGVQACSVTQSCPTLCNLMGCSPPVSSLHGIFQARILNGLLFPPPGDLPDPGIKPVCLALAGRFFPTAPPSFLV